MNTSSQSGLYTVTTLTGSVYELHLFRAPEGEVLGTLKRLPAMVPAADGGDPSEPMRRDSEAIPFTGFTDFEAGDRPVFYLNLRADGTETYRTLSTVQGIARARTVPLAAPSVAYARELATYAHQEQKRHTENGAVPYIEHPEDVAQRAKAWVLPEHQNLVEVIGLLHDVEEDSSERMSQFLGAPFFQVVKKEFGIPVLRALQALTVPAGADYTEHVRESLSDPVVVVVKLADVTSNALQLTPNHPRYEKLAAKYADVVSLLRQALHRQDVKDLLADPDAVYREFVAGANAAGFDISA